MWLLVGGGGKRDSKQQVGFSSDCTASPVDGAGVNHSFESEKSITPPRPRVLFPDDYEDEEDKLSKIEPKNLMEVCDPQSLPVTPAVVVVSSRSSKQ